MISKSLLTIASVTLLFLILPQTTRAQSRTVKGKVDQERENATKRGEKISSICPQDCDKSESLADVEKGKALKLPKPIYPDSARQEGAAGSVEVKVIIDEEGKVIAADAISGHLSLRDVSVEAARKALFSPTRICGSAVKVTGVIVYNFVQ
jgi:TonB family protein